SASYSVPVARNHQSVFTLNDAPARPHLHALPTRRSSDLTNTGNVPQAITVNDTPALDNFSCSPVNGSSVDPGQSMTCTGSHTVTDRKSTRVNSSHTWCSYAAFGTQTYADDIVPGVQNKKL